MVNQSHLSDTVAFWVTSQLLLQEFDGLCRLEYNQSINTPKWYFGDEKQFVS